MPSSKRPLRGELANIRAWVMAHDLQRALDNLPPASSLAISPQTLALSEHPYKLHIGSCSIYAPDSPVCLGFTKTLRDGYELRIFIDNEIHPVDVLDHVKLLEPFGRLWQVTQSWTWTGTRTRNRHGFKDMRWTLLKTFAYWYLLEYAEKNRKEGASRLRLPEKDYKYLVKGLGMLGDEPYETGSPTEQKRVIPVRAERKRQISSTEDSGGEDESDRSKRRAVDIKEEDDDMEWNETAPLQDRPQRSLPATNGTPAQVDGFTKVKEEDDEVAQNETAPLQNRSQRSPSATNGTPAQVDGFTKVKDMMKIDTKLSAKYAIRLAKAESLRKRLDNHREAMKRAMADVVAEASGRPYGA